MQSSAMMEKRKGFLKYDIRRYMITKTFRYASEPKMRLREERSFSPLFLLIRRFDSRARSVAI
jgi:hypothetical protein